MIHPIPSGTRDVFVEASEASGQSQPHVDFVTDDLTAFLSGLPIPRT